MISFHPQRLALYALLVLALMQPSNTAAEEEKSYPSVEGELVVEIQNDNFYNSDDSTAERNELFTTTEPTVKFNFSKRLSVTAHAVFEPVQGARSDDDDRYFQAHGLYIEDLFLQYQTNGLSFKNGKFGQSFGQAWDTAPGIYGTDFAEDYELAERIGLEIGYTFKSKSVGEHTLKAGTFFQDRTFLSNSAITNRGRTVASAGGPSNSGILNSYAVSLEGPIPVTPDLGYHLAYADQAQGEGNTSRQRGFVVNLNYSKIIGDVTFAPMIEYAYFDGWDGTDNQQRYFITAALTTEWKDFKLALSYTGRNTDPASGSNVNDDLFQASIGYNFGCKVFAGCLSFDTGYRFAEESGTDTHAWGALLAYTYNFDHALDGKKK